MNITTTLFGRAAFYAVTVVLGMALALAELDQGKLDNFLRFAAGVLIVFVIELYLGRSEYRQHAAQTKIPHIDQISKQAKFLHHLILPLITYLSIMGFAYFNRQAHLRVSILALTLFLFTVLFINIRAYYAHTINVLESTHFVYDIIKLVVFFCACDSLLNLTLSYNLGPLGAVAIAGVSIGLMLLMLLRYSKIEMISIIMVIILSVIIAGVAMFLLSEGRLNPIQMSLMTFLSFYVGSAALHHEMDHNLTFTIVVEYIAILVIAITLMYGLSN